MNITIKQIRTAALAATFSAVALTGSAFAGASDTSTRLLSAKFEPRQVVQVEVGDFHFKPGQVAPIHTHTAPAIGYVAKGTIIYQVEGEAPQILSAGDAFYEPAGPRILRFDNASATREAIFLDFNLEQAGEPFIVFEEKPTQAIDRRTLPTTKLSGVSVDQVNVHSNDLQPGGQIKLETVNPTFGIVAEGVIELRVNGKATQRIIAGKTFSLPTPGAQATLVNASSEVPAKVITFRLH